MACSDPCCHCNSSPAHAEITINEVDADGAGSIQLSVSPGSGSYSLNLRSGSIYVYDDWYAIEKTAARGFVHVGQIEDMLKEMGIEVTLIDHRAKS
jgi:hypothetical protein